jgi:hypothetical protein
MSRISIICLLSGALAVPALPANSASAGSLTVQTPKVTVSTPTPPKLKNSTGAVQYRNGGAQYPNSRKTGRTGLDSITVKRGLTSDQSLQQWEQGIGGK